ncbi:MAG: hypothetical protein RSC49_04665 [Clostridium sp.]
MKENKVVLLREYSSVLSSYLDDGYLVKMVSSGVDDKGPFCYVVLERDKEEEEKPKKTLRWKGSE